jgi:hypothetical protein
MKVICIILIVLVAMLAVFFLICLILGMTTKHTRMSPPNTPTLEVDEKRDFLLDDYDESMMENRL